MFLPESYQEFVYLMPSDTKIAVKNATASGVVNVFTVRYRIIYRVLDKDVYVLLIFDGRRDMQSLLQRRLLDA